MKGILAAAASALVLAPVASRADSNINATDKFAYGANIGWINFKHDQPSAPEGIVVGASFLSGFAYSANCGWVNFGDGTPDDGFSYANDSATDFGVNHDGAGNLTGRAYGANIGWVTFEQTYGQPQIDLGTGYFSGFAYGANVGWINLGTGDLAVDSIDPGPDTDNDMIADLWELEQGAANGTPGDLGLLNKPGDADGDGVSDVDEYNADSNPFDALDYLRVVTINADDSATDNILLEWTSSERRVYDVQKSDDLVTAFGDFAGQTGIPGAAVTTSTTFTDPLGIDDFYRIEASVPLQP